MSRTAGSAFGQLAAPEAAFSTSSRLRLPQASASLGQPAACAALAGHIGRRVHKPGPFSAQASTLALFDKSTSITVCKSSNRQVRAALEPLGKLAEQLQTAGVAESIRDKDFEACTPHRARTPG